MQIGIQLVEYQDRQIIKNKKCIQDKIFTQIKILIHDKILIQDKILNLYYLSKLDLSLFLFICLPRYDNHWPWPMGHNIFPSPVTYQLFCFPAATPFGLPCHTVWSSMLQPFGLPCHNNTTNLGIFKKWSAFFVLLILPEILTILVYLKKLKKYLR